MQFSLYCAIVILLVLKHVQTSQKRFKRAHMDNFNILLNIYKMNPLKKSKIYKTFSDQILLPNRPDVRSIAMNFDSNESRKERLANTNLHLKQIEKFIHVTNPKKKVMQRPDYDIENIDSEIFSVNMVMNDPSGIGTNENKKADERNFSSILGHLESGEIGDKLPVTKMVRVNNTIINDNRDSSEIDFNEIGLNDNYTNFFMKVSYETFGDKKGKEVNVNHLDRLKEERKLNEGVVVLR